ncbi:hypothetical protein GCM10007933_09740 [Zoogloea oryzae]|uniref:Uncharacterized protein n=1 Tax=Zoogloea oryzae TaxID=310767 RepID=A0ABQ6FA45_9RHOO|nr:hypothetical protein GCM10007933_09740 [Zoogloea oryzae]
MHAQALTEFLERATQMRLNGLRATDQENSGIAISAQKMQRGRNRYRRAVIAPHAVNGQGDSHSALNGEKWVDKL